MTLEKYLRIDPKLVHHTMQFLAAHDKKSLIANSFSQRNVDGIVRDVPSIGEYSK